MTTGELERLEQAARDDARHPALERGLDALMSVQRPVVLAHLRSIRSRRPDASPAQVLAILERRYLAAVTTGGAAVGAASVIPAVGVGTSLALSGVETVAFLEASALFAQSVCEVHGIAVTEPERARTLVMTLILGQGGQELIRQFAGQAMGGQPVDRTAFWGELIAKNLPRAAFGQIADQIRKAFVKRYAVRQGGSVVGRAVPFGIGAVIGGTGNHLLGRQIVRAARTAFPPAPAVFPDSLRFTPKPPRAPKQPKPVRASRMPRMLQRGRSAPALPPPHPDDLRDGPPPPVE